LRSVFCVGIEICGGQGAPASQGVCQLLTSDRGRI
jgi:hypothetical protein